MSGDQVVKMKMKLFIDNKCNRVVYAEAGKDCVDFLLYVFSMPLGSAMRLLLNGTGGLRNLYSSIEELSDDYLMECHTKEGLLNPYSATTSIQQFAFGQSTHKWTKWYLSDCKFAYGPQSQVTNYPSTLKRNGGYVKEQVTYMITDGLAVKPLSSTSTLALLSQLDVMNVGCIAEAEVSIDATLGMELLKTSLVSNTVLTDTFLAKINAK